MAGISDLWRTKIYGETANIWRKDTALRNRCLEIFPDTFKVKLIAKYKVLYIGSKAIIIEIT